MMRMLRFRPRYSLLTLLILTALVAGGVKLWRGPHHAVEQPKADEEHEFTYTRDLGGNRVIHGPYVERKFQPGVGTLQEVNILYYRGGAKSPWLYTLVINKLMANSTSSPVEFHSLLALSPNEQLEWNTAIEQERTRFPTPEQQLLGYWWWRVN
jgi:hypothetical protein